MNREEVIRMAREAGMEANESPKAVKALGHSVPLLWLERFAALVAAAERRKHQADIETWKAEAATAEKWRALALCKDPVEPGKIVQEIQREAMERERDACAKVCSSRAMRCELEANQAIENGEHDESSAIRSTAWQISVCAEAIRARGNP